MSQPLVMVGKGMAAVRLVDELARSALGRYAIAVIGDQPRLAYNRVLLSSVLAGEATSQEIEPKPASWWRDRGVTLTYGSAAIRVDLDRSAVQLADDNMLPFAKLVLATGSVPLRLNLPGAYLSDVHTFRDSRDADALLELAQQKKRVVVVGGGLLGSGEFTGAEGSEAIVLNDARCGIYKKLVIGEGRLTGAVLVGDTKHALWYLDLIRSETPIAKFRGELMFGPPAARPEAA